MKNSIEYLKGCKVPSVSEKMSAEFLEREGKSRRDKRNAWGNDDFKALIKKNMEGYKNEQS